MPEAHAPDDSAEARCPVTLTVNGKPRSLLVDGDSRLLTVLRDELGLTGAKAGCEVGVCGACTVLVDGAPTSSCLTFAAQADGSEVLTVEGLEAFPALRGLQDGFLAEGGFQCGFCTSGQLVTIASLVLSGELAELSEEDIRERMLGNLCRCGAYYGIMRAIGRAKEAVKEGMAE
jgi:xanthine dehydrogenase YagT iron-sulfur-binding subunit